MSGGDLIYSKINKKMKFSHSIVIAALLGSLSFTEVNAVAIKQSEASRLMESIDVDMENL